MISAKALLKDVERILIAKHHVALKRADANMLANAIGEASVLHIGKAWAEGEAARQKTRQAHYLSAEYLTGRLVFNNLYCMGVLDDVRELLKFKGVDIAILEDVEDNALGNGGLGRLAACFLDSAACENLPLTGYGLRYRYGLFKQFIDGAQFEAPDDWTRFGDPWSVRRDELRVTVPMATGDVYAVPYDTPVIGLNGGVRTLRLWQTESAREFDLTLFNDYKYKEACADKNAAEDITKVLYPNDWDIEGKRLRLKQQYVLSSASMQDILGEYERRHGRNYRYFAREHIIQLNDTHPVMAVPELIRLLTERGVAFMRAMNYAKRAFAYTNHTVMPEALEQWDLELIASVSPDIARILKRIDKKCAAETGMRIIRGSRVSMADLAVYMSCFVNGVAELHTRLIKAKLFGQWHAIAPDKFLNVTNGVTQRRWLGLCNPELCKFLYKHTGYDCAIHPEALIKLDERIDSTLAREFMGVKRIKKAQLSEYIYAREGVLLPEEFIYDVQIKRLHEYKRQLMNALSIYDIYMELKSGSLPDFPPTACIFGGKAAPGYARAKAVIRYICALADLINSDPDVNSKLRVCFVSNYNCSYAEKLIPAAELSEQISPAGTEASGTGNMKFMLNGAVTIGTYDGANIEIAEAAGPENEFIFGADITEIESVRDSYDPTAIYNSDKRVRRAVDSIKTLADDSDGALAELWASLLTGAHWHKPDNYFVLYDFTAYQEARLKAYYLRANDPEAFYMMCLKNIARAGGFSSDRTIREYAENIWRIAPLKRAERDNK